jgi:hypothetical protein
VNKPIGVVLVIAQRGIARFQVADRLRVFQDLQAPLNPFEPCRIKSGFLRHISPTCFAPPRIAVAAENWIKG